MRVHGTKNKKTPLRDAEEALAKARTGEAMVDPLHVMETIMMHYHTQAFSKKALNKPEAEIDAAMALGLHAAEQCAPYRHRPYRNDQAIWRSKQSAANAGHGYGRRAQGRDYEAPENPGVGAGP